MKECIDCGKETTGIRCMDCYRKSKTKHGYYSGKHFCVDCGKEVSVGYIKRCRKCSNKILIKEKKGIYSEQSIVKRSKSLTGRKLSEETKRKIGLKSKGRWAGEKNPNFGKKARKKERHPQWKGGKHYHALHNKARKLFMKEECEKCGLLLSEYNHSRKNNFDMHCKSGNYLIMEEWNWETLCSPCHATIDNPMKNFIKYLEEEYGYRKRNPRIY